MSVIKPLGIANKTRRNFLLTSSVVGLLGGCGHARFFELAWHEEVALPAGGSVWVYVKTIYERMSNAWDEYSGLVPRDTYLEFDSGGAAGRVGQLFKGYWPIFLGRDGADWYAVISGGPYVVEKNKMGAPLTSKEPGQDWEMFSNNECLRNSKGNIWVVLSRGRWVPHPGGWCLINSNS